MFEALRVGEIAQRVSVDGQGTRPRESQEAPGGRDLPSRGREPAKRTETRQVLEDPHPVCLPSRAEQTALHIVGTEQVSVDSVNKS